MIPYVWLNALNLGNIFYSSHSDSGRIFGRVTRIRVGGARCGTGHGSDHVPNAWYLMEVSREITGICWVVSFCHWSV